jgi:hypothetical protein
MLITFGSVKGSPGTTTWALALAARWPQPGPAPVVVELDGAGGDLGSRWHIHDEPGLAGLVMGARHHPLGDGTEFVQRLPVGVDVVVAPPSDAAAATIAEFATRGPAVLRELAATRPVFADLGRLDPHSPLLSYLDKADELLLVARPVSEELRHLRTRVAMLAGRCPLVRLVLVGDGPYRPDEIATYLDLTVAALVPADATGAAILAGRRRQATGWTRRPLLAAARSLALTYDAAPVPVAGPDAAATVTDTTATPPVTSVEVP